MKTWILSLMILSFSISAMAGDPAFGISSGTGKNDGIVIGDYNLFDQDVYMYGMRRYGGGFSRMQVGNGVGLHLNSDGGVFLNSSTMRVSLEPGAGQVVLNSNAGAESSYQWRPMVGAGPQVKVLGSEILLVGRAGLAIGNYGKYGIMPGFNGALGLGLYVDRHVSCTFTEFSDKSLFALNVENADFLVRLEQNIGLRKEQIGTLMWRRGL